MINLEYDITGATTKFAQIPVARAISTQRIRNPTRILGHDLLIDIYNPEIKRANYDAIWKFQSKPAEIQRAYYDAIWLIWITKNEAQIQFTRRARKFQRL